MKTATTLEVPEVPQVPEFREVPQAPELLEAVEDLQGPPEAMTLLLLGSRETPALVQSPPWLLLDYRPNRGG